MWSWCQQRTDPAVVITPIGRTENPLETNTVKCYTVISVTEALILNWRYVGVGCVFSTLPHENHSEE